MANTSLLVASLLLVCAAFASALPSSGLPHLRPELAAKTNAFSRTNVAANMRPATDTMRLKGGGLPPTKTIVIHLMLHCMCRFSASIS
eukprot:384111-Rhodomonas_salina.1